MKVELKEDQAIITREPADPKIYKESTLFYHIKQALIKQGHDVIIKSPGKDTMFCHLTSMPFYIRTRKYKKGVTSFWIVDSDHAIRLAYENYNRLGEVTFTLQWKIFDKELEQEKVAA